MTKIAIISVFRRYYDNIEVLIGTRKNKDLVLPGGRLEKDELPCVAAIRELKEETGIEITELVELSINIKKKKIVYGFCVLVDLDVELKPNDDICELSWHNISKVPLLSRGQNVIVCEAIRVLFS